MPRSAICPEQTSSDETIFIVDDDAGIRDGLSLLLGLHGYRSMVFDSASIFLAACAPCWRGCALIDVRMSDMGGLQLQRTLAVKHPEIPVIMMSGHSSVAVARQAFKAGAIDFLAKPISEDELIAAVHESFGRTRTQLTREMSSSRQTRALLLYGFLTDREKQVLQLLADGMTSRMVADALAISHRTVETYKGRMMEKLKVRKLSELVRIATLANAALLMS